MVQHTSFRITVRLDAEHDADLIAWIESISPGNRSALIREVWRRGLAEISTRESIDTVELRRVIAEELDRALTNVRLQSNLNNRPQDDSEAEEMYGAKLDHMLGNLSSDLDP